MADLQCIEFHGDSMSTCKNEETGKVYCVPREIAENLGISWQPQHRKLSKSRFYQQHMTRHHMVTSQGAVEMLLLDIDYLPTWLTSISPEKVKGAVREKLLDYQEECARALRDYWTKGAAFNPRTETEEPEKFWQLRETKAPFEKQWEGIIAASLNALSDCKRRGVPKLPTDMGSPRVAGVVPKKIHDIYVGTMGPETYEEAKARKLREKAPTIQQLIGKVSLDMQRGMLLVLGIAARSEEEYTDLLEVALGGEQLTMPTRWRNSELAPGETRTEQGATPC